MERHRDILVLMVSWVFICQTRQIVHPECVQFSECQLYLHRDVSEKNVLETTKRIFHSEKSRQTKKGSIWDTRLFSKCRLVGTSLDSH